MFRSIWEQAALGFPLLLHAQANCQRGSLSGKSHRAAPPYMTQTMPSSQAMSMFQDGHEFHSRVSIWEAKARLVQGWKTVQTEIALLAMRIAVHSS